MKLINEDNQLKQMANYNKKRQKGMSPFTKLDAGDVEHNQAFFNNAMGNSSGGECMAESFEDEIEVNKLEGSFSMEIAEAQDVFDLDAAEMAIEAAYEDGDISEEGYNLLMEEADEKRKELESGEDGSMTEDINKSKKIIKEDQQGLLPAWSQESAEVTNNSFDRPDIVRQTVRSFTAKHAQRSRYTFDDGAAIVKSFSDDEEDELHVRVPQGAYCCITYRTIRDFYYEVKVPAHCYVWNGKYWYCIDFEKESEEGLCLDKVFGKDIYNELYEYFKERADSAEDKYDINSAFYELADISDKIPYTLNNELFDYLEQKDIEIRTAAKEDPDENEEPIEESFENMAYDISDFIFDAHYGSQHVTELDVATPSDIDSYYRLIKTVEEAEKFNYHSDYWGADDAYQEENVELIEALSPYVDEMVKIEYEDGIIKGKLLGIAIDRQYNSINHTKVILDAIEELETVTESIEEIEADEKKVEPQQINLRKALNEIDMNTMETDFVNMYEAAKLTLEEKQKLALMLAKGEDLNAIYDFLAARCDKYLHSESHVIGENKENK